jgi:LPS-assembly lipoprotein
MKESVASAKAGGQGNGNAFALDSRLRGNDEVFGLRRSFLRLAMLAVLMAPLAGCGFRPLYGGSTAGGFDPDLAAIKVQPIADRQGQLLGLALRERLNPRGTAVPERYVLNVVLALSRADLGIQRDATSTRAEIQGSATYTLTPPRSDNVIFSGKSLSTSSFNILSDGYATKVAEDDARERAIHDISEDMAMTLSLFMRSHRQAAN